MLAQFFPWDKFLVTNSLGKSIYRFSGFLCILPNFPKKTYTILHSSLSIYEMSHSSPCFPWQWILKANTTLMCCQGIFWTCGIFPQVYSDYESNPQLRQAIEFACHQFYILHRKPFVLQLFASVAPLLEFPVSKLCRNRWRSTEWETQSLFIQSLL